MLEAHIWDILTYTVLSKADMNMSLKGPRKQLKDRQPKTDRPGQLSSYEVPVAINSNFIFNMTPSQKPQRPVSIVGFHLQSAGSSESEW